MALEFGSRGEDGKKGVYWIGQNGNLYVKGNGTDTQDFGKFEGEQGEGLYAENGGIAKSYYRQINDWNQADKEKQVYSDPRQGGGGGYYNPQAAAEAKARADEIAKYREQERVASEGLGRLDRQRDIWRGNVENNYANQLNDLENSYTQSKGAYEMNKRDSEAQNRAVRSQIMEDANNQTNALR